MKNIALLTCKDLPELIESDRKLIPLFEKEGYKAEPVIWNDELIKWEKYDALIFRNIWDYFLYESEFDFWLEQIDKLNLMSFNPIKVIQKNKHKFYLKEMKDAGINIIPSVFIPKTSHFDLKDFISESSWNQIILKPAVSAGSYMTELFELKDVEKINNKIKTIAADREWILQEFMPEIQTEGELSFIFFNKSFSHSVIKKPKTGDFRIQSQFGGTYSNYNPEKSLLQDLQNIIDFIPNDLLYARVDGVIRNNSFFLMELELIEPDLFFNFVEDGPQRFVNAFLEVNK